MKGTAGGRAGEGTAVYKHCCCMQSREMAQMSPFAKQNRDTDGKNKRMDTKGERRGGMNWETGIDISTSYIEIHS